MDTDGNGNGHGNGQVYVKFGSRPNQEVPIEWAEELLTRLAEGHPAVFSKLLARVALGR